MSGKDQPQLSNGSSRFLGRRRASCICLLLLVAVPIAYPIIASLISGEWNGLRDEMVKYRHLMEPDRYADQVAELEQHFSRVDGIPLLYFSDNKSAPFLLNLLCNLHFLEQSLQQPILARVIVIATERTAYNIIRAHSVRVPTVYFPADEAFQLQTWSNASVVHVAYPLGWGIRSCAVHGLLQRVHKPVCFSNVDTVWSRNFFPILDAAEEKTPSYDVIFDRTGYWGPMRQFGEYATFCWRPSAVGKAIFAKLHNEIYENAAFDGNVLTDYCAKKVLNVSCAWFENQHTASGAFWVLSPAKRQQFYPYVFHLSPWFYFHHDRMEVKLRRYRKTGMWFLTDGAVESQCNATAFNAFNDEAGQKHIIDMPLEENMLIPWLVHEVLQYFLVIVSLLSRFQQFLTGFL